MGQTTFLGIAERVLQEERKPMTPEEIWDIVVAKGYDAEVATKGKTPWRSIGAQMFVNMRDKKDSRFVKAGVRPRRFALRSFYSGDPDEIVLEIQDTQEETKYLEKHLHPFLAFYGYFYKGAYLKTINHASSRKKEFSEWIHPDMVGCRFLHEDWKECLVSFRRQFNSLPVEMLSFELKRELNFSNLRESFFQAVSNSSWANEGYLAAPTILEEEDFIDELGRLSTSFGIGVIKINLDDPDSSQELFPPRHKDYLDWDAMNKLAINRDFAEFLKRVENDVRTVEIRKERYDKVFDKEELLEQLKTAK